MMKTQNSIKVLLAINIALVFNQQSLLGQSWNLGPTTIGSGQNILGTSTLNPAASDKRDIRFGTLGVERMRLMGETGFNLGFLGIGIIAPQAQLHINATTLPTPTGELFRTNGPSTSDNAWRMFTGSGTGTEKAALFVPANTNNLVIRATQTFGTIQLQTRPALFAIPITRMTIIDGGTGVNNIVAIGNNFTIPRTQLHINGETAVGVYTQLTNASTNASPLAPNPTDGFKIGIDAAGNAEIRQQENLPLIFFTNNIQRATIDANGNAGIDISNPTAKLHIKPTGNTAGTSSFKIDDFAQSQSLFEIRDDGSIFSGNSAPTFSSGTFHMLDCIFPFPAPNPGQYNSCITALGRSGGFGLPDLISGGEFYATDATYIIRGVYGSTYRNTPLAPIMSVGVWGNASDNPFFPVGQTDLYGGYFSATEGTGRNIGVWTTATSINDLGSFDIAVWANIKDDGDSDPDMAGYFDGKVVSSFGFMIISDTTLKDDISYLTNGLDILRQINPISFSFKQNEFPQMSLPNGTHYGFDANEVDSILPTIVADSLIHPEERDTAGAVISDPVNFKAMNVSEIIPFTVSAIKQLDSAVTALQNAPVGVTGTGTANYLTKWSGANTVTSSQVQDNGTTVKIGAGTLSGFPLTERFNVLGNAPNSIEGLGHFNSDQSTSRSQFFLSNSGGGVWENNTLAVMVHGSNFSFLGNDAYYIGQSNKGQAIVAAQGSELTKLAIGTYNSMPMSLFTNNTERLFINSSGNVGIGTSAPTEALHVIGNILATGSITQNSDASLKQNIDSIDNALGIILQLQPHTFNFDTANYAFLNLPSGKQFGLTAQEAETVLPEIVSSSLFPQVNPGSNTTQSAGSPIPETHYKTVNYTALIPILIQAVKEQQEKINALESTVSTCCSTSVKTTGSIPSTEVELATKSSILWQNFPNPFGDGTVIRYFVSDKSVSASIVFYDEFGNEVKNMELPHKGEKAELNLSTTNLASGVYSYSLVVDGKIVDTKKMLKVK